MEAHLKRQDARLALLAVQAALGLGARPPLPPHELVTTGPRPRGALVFLRRTHYEPLPAKPEPFAAGLGTCAAFGVS